QEALVIRVCCELVIAIQVAVADALFESIDDRRRLRKLDDAADLYARPQLELDARDQTEQTVSADGQAKQVLVLCAGAGADLAIGSNQIEGLHLIDDRLQVQPASVRIAGQRAGDAQSV